MGKSKC